MIKEIQVKDVKEIFDKYMVYDFGKDELKPLELLEDLMRQGLMKGIVYVHENKIKGYCFFINDEEYTYIDFFAILSEYRHSGIGTAFLTEIKEVYDNIYLEAEDKKYAKDDEDLRIRDRRLEFYKRAGFNITDISWRAFGVQYNILTTATEYDEERIEKSLIKIYDTIFKNKEYINCTQIF